MYSRTIDLPSGATLALSAKSFSHTAKRVEQDAAILKAEAQAGTQHPRTIIEAYAASKADLEALKAASKAEIEVITKALAVLDGANEPASTHPLLMTVREMRHAADAFAQAQNPLTQEKAASLIEDTRGQLKAALDYASRAVAEHEHRVESAHSKLAEAFRAAVATYSGNFGFSLKAAANLLAIAGIPEDETILPAPDFDPRLPGDHPARKAAVLQVLCKSKEAEIAMQRQHVETKRKRGERRKSVAELALADLKQIGDR